MALTFPTISKAAPTSGRFSLVPNTQVFQSPLNRTVQTVELPGARWTCQYNFNNLAEADVRMLQAWLARLRGASGRFYMWNMTHPDPSGSALGTPLVNGAGQTGTTLVTDGWTASQTNLLLPGDHFSVGNELKIITAICASSAGGASTLSFEPPLRAHPADNAAITTYRPTCIMRLKDDNQDQLQMKVGRVTDFQLEGIEVFA